MLEEMVKERTNEINEKNETLQNQTEELTSQRDELDASNSVKDKLFSIISHDLRSPFNTLKGFTNLIKSRYDGYTDEERKKMIEIINDSSDQVYSLLDNLLNWSRAQRGTLHFNPRMTNIVSLIDSKIDLMNFQAENKNIKIEFDHTPEDIEFEIDPDLINVVIHNLLTNAIKFSHAEGKIRVNSKIENNHLIISVSDNGIGISKDDAKKLFSHDARFTSKGTNQEPGTGLGLIICKDFIEIHHGEIWLESELNKGSSFFIDIPVTLP
jgi:two-component system sensor histidine kinase/response regulator